MSDVAPITTQPVKINGFGLEDESGENETERKKKNKTCWQRFCASFNHCCENLTDCLDFWCCKNECYNFCCNYNDIDDDDEGVAEVGLNSNRGEQAVMTVIREVVENQGNENQESYTQLDLDKSEIQLTGDDDKPSGDHSGGSHDYSVGNRDNSESHHKEHTGAHQNHAGGHHHHSGGHHEHSGGPHEHSGHHGVDHSIGYSDTSHSGVDHGGYTGGGDSGGGDSGGGDCGGGDSGGGDCGGCD